VYAGLCSVHRALLSLNRRLRVHILVCVYIQVQVYVVFEARTADAGLFSVYRALFERM